MGRNKKGKASDTHEAAATAEMENASFEQEVPDDSPASHTESDSSVVEEQPAPKKKAYHGNKLNRGAGGKAKKEEPVREPHPQTATAETNGAATPGEEQDEGDAVSGAAEQLEDGAAVARHEPVEVLYCPICTFPAEMCEYSGMYEQCRPWLLEHAKELAEAEERGRKRRALTERDRLERLVQGRGAKKGIERIVLIEVSQRKGRKMTTSVKGMDLFGLNLKDLSREWKKMFSCGAGVTTSEETKQNSIDIQGNVAAQLIELLPERYNIPKESLYQMEDKKKVKCYAGS